MSNFKSEINACDVRLSDRKQLEAFRLKRCKWLEMLGGQSVNSIHNQITNLLWYSTLFYVLNESRRHDSTNAINTALWDMLFKGYVVQMGTAIRRLVDKDLKTNSLRVILLEMKLNHHLLTRENIVCYDGWPFDSKIAEENYYRNNISDGEFQSLPMEGSFAWFRSELAHKAFNKIADSLVEGQRKSKVDINLLDKLIAELNKPEISRVKRWVDRQIAHSEHAFDPKNPDFQPTLNDIEESIKTIIQVRQFISTGILFDADYGGVPTPQYDVFQHLDKPIISKKEMPNLDVYWDKRVEICASWAAADSGYENKFLSKT